MNAAERCEKGVLFISNLNIELTSLFPLIKNRKNG
jgi:hypothetical protein